ncbi:MAG: NADH-quinone oxidoreductase subunit L [Deltaproteobacteria bacterium]|nr:NADH-quinone oxidoreductase subunit L [Deltaproteobacteria bacterium]
MNYELSNLIIIATLLPFGGALLNGIFGKLISNRLSGIIASLTIGVSFVLFVIFYLYVVKNSKVPYVIEISNWLFLGKFQADISLLADRLSIIMSLMVTGVSALIHVYSIGYMEKEKGIKRYFSYLNLFVGFMLVLVMAENIVLMFVGWEGVGLCSYLLIGFWFSEEEKANAARKAFIVNRIGDLAFILGILLILSYFNTASFRLINDGAYKLPTTIAFFITILLFIGATGKSAQIPLYVWLPDAMVGPTPVSALIHAATMVTAGVYMITRLGNLFLMSEMTLAIIMLVGSFTALFSATIAITQNDIKKVLAYSTISQLGFMFSAAGAYAFSAAMFHLVTHAFFKAALFLLAGSVIHALSGEQDINRMGGLEKYLPHTSLMFWLASLTIAGIPPFSAFFSKDEILYKVFINENSVVPLAPKISYTMLIITSFLTALYISRLYFKVFTGDYKGSLKPHESPKVMLVPIYILTVLFAIFGPIGMGSGIGHILEIPARIFGKDLHLVNTFERLVGPSIASFGTISLDVSLEIFMIFISVIVAFAGWLLGRYLYCHQPSPVVEVINQKFYRVQNIIYRKYFVDEVYDFLIVKPYYYISRSLFELIDRVIIEFIIIGFIVKVTYITGYLLRFFQNGYLYKIICVGLIGLGILVYFMMGK